ncbi:uncharacterized protein G2W53_019739 [Senna tora]|uniref:Uncharacterized protein n=1 Tax=Senna tora TaxID=362788 RepID=A0A834WM90_9FABA|nr:uncharacterized protein G2W53_019739 [Senna tora]
MAGITMTGWADGNGIDWVIRGRKGLRD